MDKFKYKVGFYFDVKIHEHDGGDRTYLAELFRVIETLNKRGLFECVALLEVNTSGSGHLPSMDGFREIRLPVLGDVCTHIYGCFRRKTKFSYSRNYHSVDRYSYL